MHEKALSYVKNRTLLQNKQRSFPDLLGAIMQVGRRRIASIDLNPVMAKAKGDGAAVADALVELAHG